MIDIAPLCEALVALLREEFGAELLGVLATGSRVHGTPGPTSDLDAHVLITTPRRQRRNILLGGVEIEMFLNPPARVRGYFAEGHAGTLHMFAFGKPVYDPQALVAQLQAEATAIWQAGPPPIAANERWHPRYFLADMLRDLVDLSGDAASASLQIARIVDRSLTEHYRINRRWPEKPKRILADLARWSPEVARLASAALVERPLAARHSTAEQLVAAVLAPIGGPMPLEWRIDWEQLEQGAT